MIDGSIMNIIYCGWDKNNNFLESAMLRICDLNQIIKNYAYRMQQRMEELDHYRCYMAREDGDEEAADDAICRYAGCVSADQRDIKLAVKLKERVIQIYDFFKGKSNSQNVLSAIQTSIDQTLSSFITADSVRLGDMLAYVSTITRRGCLIKPTAQKKPIMSRSTLKPPKATEKAAVCSVFNLQRRPSTASKVRTTAVERWRLSELVEQLWGAL
jgi:hypothetical protein